MVTKIPDLTPTVIDSETGEVIRQESDHPDLEKYRAEGKELWAKFWAERRKRSAVYESQGKINQ